MVLLTTIILILTLTMLVLSLLHAVFLYIKVSSQVMSTHEALYQLEAQALRLAVANHDPQCEVLEEDPNQSIEKLRHYSECLLTANKRQYTYLINDLGVYPCLHIVYGKKTYSSHHWLITLASAVPREHILQLRMARPVKEVACDRFEAREINKGVISWRYLPYTTN